MGPIDRAAFAAVAHLIGPWAVEVRLTFRLLLGGYAGAPAALLKWEAFAVGPALRSRHAREGDADLVDRAVRIRRALSGDRRPVDAVPPRATTHASSNVARRVALPIADPRVPQSVAAEAAAVPLQAGVDGTDVSAALDAGRDAEATALVHR